MPQSIAETCVPRSILDSDLYKFTMQCAVLRNFPNVVASYKLTIRDKSLRFTKDAVDIFRDAISLTSSLALTPEERAWMLKEWPDLFPVDYVDYLSNYRFKPEQAKIVFVPAPGESDLGTIELEFVGPWHETILWEVPAMSCLSEVYFKTMDTDWNYDGQAKRTHEKTRQMLSGGCLVAEFGARRRRSYEAQDIVIESMLRASQELKGPGHVIGTSNVHFAHKYKTKPIGTVAHEWFMGIGALKGYEKANDIALQMWEDTFPQASLIALPDTFSSEPFFKAFISNPTRAKKWHGLRQDSGDPVAFSKRAKEVYQSLGIDHTQKAVIYSDSLNVEEALRLQKLNEEELGFKCSFGIGTFMTNDFCSAKTKEKSKAMNMVIKLFSVDSKPCIKISDDLTKNTGDRDTVLKVKATLGLPLE